MLRRSAPYWTHEIQISRAINTNDPDIFETVKKAAAVAKPALQGGEILLSFVDRKQKSLVFPGLKVPAQPARNV